MNLNILNKPAWDPEIGVCSDTPRFSYKGPKTAVRAGSLVVHAGVRARGGVRVWDRVGIPGGLYRGGTQPLREVPVQRSGPRRTLQGSGVGGTGAGIPMVRGTAAGTVLVPPSARSVHPVALPVPGPRNAASQPIRARLTVISWKLSQNR